jgi:uncharacterized protein YodC (DUF2158 family)
MQTQAADVSPEEAALAAQFPPGTLVKLKSGGPAMTVTTTSSGKVWTAHWESESDFLSMRPAQRVVSRNWHPDVLAKQEA